MLVLLSSLATAAESSDDTWKLEHLYPSVEAFEAGRKEAEAKIAELPRCRGRLGESAVVLLECLDQDYAVAQALGRLSSYTSNHSAADTRDDAWQARDDSVNQLYTRYAEAISWQQPELLALGAEKVEAFLAAEPKLGPYAYPLRATLRRGEHILSSAEERILALSTAVTGRPNDTYDTFVNAELPWPQLPLPDGTTTRLQQSEYGRLRSHPDPVVRKQVFDTFFGALEGYEGTLGSLLATQVSAHWYEAQARGYGSSVEASLANTFLPREVYDTLVREANANLPTLHRYLKLRAEMLGIDELAYSDLYVPLVASDRKYSLAESERLALESAKPLGKAYVAAMEEGFRGGWIDVYPREGKVAGAYMNDSAYGVHPYVLLNHNDDFESATTLAHEFGHAMHSHLAMAAQPYPTASYATFLAEIASTFNEALLIDWLVDHAKTDEEKLFFLGTELEGLRTTFFRQAMFGEYELAIHEHVEKGEPLTGGILTAKYAELVRRYHGPVRVDDVWTREWAFVPHFYYDFYVFQYATSLAASRQLARAVLDKDKGAVDRYLAMLKAGGSDDPYVLLKQAGVDLATPEPYRAVAQRMDEIMDEIEKIRAKQEK